MANLKNITELPVAESAEGLNLIVNDNGAAKQIAAHEVGAQADWAEMDETNAAYLKNKPFYDTREYSDITVTFDGNIAGKEAINVAENTYLVKVSDKDPSKDELIGASASMIQNGQTITVEITSDMILDDGNGNLNLGEGLCIVVKNEILEIDGITLSRGLWVACTQQDGVSVIYPSNFSWCGVTSGEPKRLDAKYLPNSVWTEEETTVKTNCDLVFKLDDHEDFTNSHLESGDFSATVEKIKRGFPASIYIYGITDVIKNGYMPSDRLAEVSSLWVRHRKIDDVEKDLLCFKTNLVDGNYYWCLHPNGDLFINELQD